MKDQRLSLKVKIKSLTDEARTIRREEQKSKDPEVICDLIEHRKGVVRRAARETLLAYGFLRGKKYNEIEQKCHCAPNWDRVKKMVEKYGVPRYSWKEWWNLSHYDKLNYQNELLGRFNNWYK